MDGIVDIDPNDPIQLAFVRRVTHLMARIARQLPDDVLMEAVTEPTNIEVLLRALQDPAAFGADLTTEANPLIEAQLRGVAMKREMLKAEGGTLSASELAGHLGISVQGVNKRRDRNRVFWLERGTGYCYPAFQIADEGLLPGIQDVLGAFTVSDPWMRVHFMLTADTRLDGQRPLDLLRAGDIEVVKRAAAAFGTHGAP
jgi:hypothetical protein